MTDRGSEVGTTKARGLMRGGSGGGTPWRWRGALALALALGAMGCDGDSGGDEGPGEGTPGSEPAPGDGTASPSPDPSEGDEGEVALVPLTLEFAARFGDDDARCGVDYPGVGSTQATVRLQDFRFFVSRVELRAADGAWVPLTLDADGMWQDGEVALLDFEDGTAECADTGNAATRDHIAGRAPAGAYTAVKFDLGVPPELNHQNASLAAAPLNVSSMFWVWQTGYKFLRLDLSNQLEPPANRWFVHLGSTGCESASPSEAPPNPCLRPHRPTILIEGFDPTTQRVVFDAAALLEGADVTFNTPDTPPGCMSGPPDAFDCGALFDALALDFETGRCFSECANESCVEHCEGQVVFRAEAR